MLSPSTTNYPLLMAKTYSEAGNLHNHGNLGVRILTQQVFSVGVCWQFCRPGYQIDDWVALLQDEGNFISIVFVLWGIYPWPLCTYYTDQSTTATTSKCEEEFGKRYLDGQVHLYIIYSWRLSIAHVRSRRMKIKGSHWCYNHALELI